MIATSNQNDFFHLIDSQFKILDKGEPPVDMLHHPLAECAQGKSVLTLSGYWKG
jgi:hypothetical protein